MKLRIHNNSVRVRLTRGEVCKLAAGQRVEQITEFSSSSRLITNVEPSQDVDRPSATFDRDRLAVRIPFQLVCQWAKTDQVGIEADQRIDNARSLRVLVEKDFDCLHLQAGKNIDTFPNPESSGKS